MSCAQLAIIHYSIFLIPRFLQLMGYGIIPDIVDKSVYILTIYRRPDGIPIGTGCECMSACRMQQISIHRSVTFAP
jgi:hypothetical protein